MDLAQLGAWMLEALQLALLLSAPVLAVSFVVGAAIEFEPGSAKLSDRAMRQLKQIADQIRGKTHKVEVHGHCSTIELAGESEFTWGLREIVGRGVVDVLEDKRIVLGCPLGSATAHR